MTFCLLSKRLHKFWREELRKPFGWETRNFYKSSRQILEHLRDYYDMCRSVVCACVIENVRLCFRSKFSAGHSDILSGIFFTRPCADDWWNTETADETLVFKPLHIKVYSRRRRRKKTVREQHILFTRWSSLPLICDEGLSYIFNVGLLTICAC